MFKFPLVQFEATNFNIIQYYYLQSTRNYLDKTMEHGSSQSKFSVTC